MGELLRICLPVFVAIALGRVLRRTGFMTAGGHAFTATLPAWIWIGLQL